MARLGQSLTNGARAAIEAQAKLLLAWNPFVNLTALRTPEQVARGHVLDSLAAVTLLRRLGGASLLDLGSGAGYPGLPLAVAMPADPCALVDSVRKKQSFLDVAGRAAAEAMRAGDEAPPRLTTIAARAEDLADEPHQREAWDFVVARAVGSLSEVAELSLPLVVAGGHLVAWKRRARDGSLERELSAARRIVRACGGARATIEPVPGLDAVGLADHVLVVVQKVGPTPDRYPRPPADRRRALLP